MAKVEVLVAAECESPADHWLARLAGYLRGDYAQSVLCIVPTGAAAARLEERLLLEFGLPGLFGGPIKTFYRLARDIARITRLGGHDISNLQRSLLLQEIAAQAEVPTLARAQRFPGFATALGDLIGDLKLAMVDPEDLGRALAKLARSESALRGKLADILNLYGRYQDILKQDKLHDAEGLMWHAVETLESAPATLGEFAAVFLHGFRTFNPVQLRLIKTIAQSAGEVFIRLHHDPTRADAFAVSERALAALRETVGARDAAPKPAVPAAGAGDIHHIAANLFRPDPETRAPDGSLVIIEAGSPSLEADEVAREIQRLASEGQACYSEIAVIARGGEAHERFAHVLKRHGVPIRRHREPLGASAVGRTVLEALRVIREGWPASAVGALLKSPRLPGDATLCARAEVSAWQNAVQEGRALWFAPWPDDDTLEARNQALGPVRDLEDGLRKARSAAELADAVRRLVNLFVSPDEPAARRDDEAARGKLETLLREVEFIADLQRGGADWTSFCEHLERAIAAATYDPGPRASEGITVLDAQGLGGEVYRVVFVVNLLEKVFPAQVREDPFIRDRERRLLAAADRDVRLDLASERQAEERLLFWRAVSCASERLYLSYPTADEAAKDSLPSFYIREVQRLFDPAIKPRQRSFSDLAPSPASAVSACDWAACILHGLARDLPPPTQARHAAHFNAWLPSHRAHPGLYLSPAPDFASALADARLLAALSGRDRPYSASELERFLICPYMYYCEKLLDLRPLEREIAPVDYGRLLHDVLAQLYREWRDETGGPVDVTTRDPDDVVARAAQLLDDALAAQPRFANLAAAQRDIERQWLGAILTRFVRDDLAFTAASGLQPAHFELEFGAGRAGRRDKQPRLSALDLGDVDGHRVLVAGRIDRVDLTPAGEAWIVDYKLSASLPDMNELDEGLVLQAPLYAMAVREGLGLAIAGTEYASIRKGSRSGVYCGDKPAGRRTKGRVVLSPEAFDEVLARAAASARECVRRIRRGEMPRGPREDCPTGCAYRGICRVDAWTLRAIKERRGER